MLARGIIALVVLCASTIHAQHTWVDVVPISNEIDEVEKRYTSELETELQNAKDDALLLYTEYTSRAGADLKIFINILTGLTNETISALSSGAIHNAPSSCRTSFEKRLKKVEYDAHRAASFSAENHHKFFLGHMIVFRMHLNKSEDYVKRCDRVIKGCGIQCESTPKVVRWRRLAKQEINRVRDDLEHSRLSYKDLLLHSHKRLNHLRKLVKIRVQEAVDELHLCAQGG